MTSTLGNEVARLLARSGKKPLSSLYIAHLKSDKWFGIRECVLARDKHTCQGCLAAAAVHVHHLCYNHLGDELLFELVALCANCHAKAHARTTRTGGNERRRRSDKKLRDREGKVIY